MNGAMAVVCCFLRKKKVTCPTSCLTDGNLNLHTPPAPKFNAILDLPMRRVHVAPPPSPTSNPSADSIICVQPWSPSLWYPPRYPQANTPHPQRHASAKAKRGTGRPGLAEILIKVCTGLQLYERNLVPLQRSLAWSVLRTALRAIRTLYSAA